MAWSWHYEYEWKIPLQLRSNSRNGKRDRPIVVYGLMTDEAGCPVSVEAWPGSTADPGTVPAQVEKLRHRFGLRQVVLEATAAC